MITYTLPKSTPKSVVCLIKALERDLERQKAMTKYYEQRVIALMYEKRTECAVITAYRYLPGGKDHQGA